MLRVLLVLLENARSDNRISLLELNYGIITSIFVSLHNPPDSSSEDRVVLILNSTNGREGYWGVRAESSTEE